MDKYYNAQQISDIMGLSKAKAYQLIREENQKLSAMGYIIIAGKIPKSWMDSKLPTAIVAH